MPGEYQKELFEEFKKEKGKFKKIAAKITERQPKLYIHVSLENIVVAAIIAIMCIIVAFALGVERGKRLSPGIVAQKGATLPEERSETAPESLMEPPGSLEKAVREVSFKPYTIQIIAYRQKELAEDEKNRLLDKKIGAFIIPSGKWYQVCAGRYSDMDGAKKALKEFKKEYTGCFIRKGVR